MLLDTIMSVSQVLYVERRQLHCEDLKRYISAFAFQIIRTQFHNSFALSSLTYCIQIVLGHVQSVHIILTRNSEARSERNLLKLIMSGVRRATNIS